MEFSNDHNVYILGAGFSRGAGLPLINDFLVQMRDSSEWLLENKRTEEAKAVEEVLKFRLEASSAAYWVNLDLENIEELFSLASVTADEMNRYTRFAIAATLDYARQTKKPNRVNMIVRGKSKLFPIPPIGGTSNYPSWAKLPSDIAHVNNPTYAGPFIVEPYVYYVGRLLGIFQDGHPKGENTFITLNYDLVLEDALTELKVPFNYGFLKESFQKLGEPNNLSCLASIPVLKLHGSVNWARRKLDDNVRTPLKDYESYDDLRLAGQEPALVPPTWKKALGGHLELVWNSAIRRLNSATRIIVIGFSIPPSDMHFKYLLAAGLQQNVSLRQILFVNHYSREEEQEEFKQRVRKLLRGAYLDSKVIDFQFSTLDWFVREHTPTEKKLPLISRPLEYGVSLEL